MTLVLTAMAGPQVTSRASAQDAEYQYDNLSRLVRVDYADGRAAFYSYDAAGSRTLVQMGGLFLAGDSMNAAQGEATDFDPLRNDSSLSGAPVSLVSVTNGAIGTASLVDGGKHIRYIAPPGATGQDSISYTATDGLLEDSSTVTITIIAGNGRPIATDDAAATDEDTQASVAVLTNDSDPESAISISWITQPQHGLATISGSSILYDPSENYFGTDSFTYGITDGVLEDIAFVNLTVNSVNDAPDAVNDSITTLEEVAKTFDPRSNDTDVETPTNALSITAKTNGSKGSVAIVTGGTQLRYTPNTNAFGGDSFTYTISDASSATDTATVSVTITNVNDPPNAVNDSKSTNEDVALTFNPRTNDTDPDGNALTITSKSNGAHGSVTILSGGTQLRYSPNGNYNGSDSFTYTISDGAGGTDTATVSMTVVSVNDPPVAVSNTYQVNPSVWTDLLVKNNDYDVDAHAFNVTAVSGGGGEKQIMSGGSYIRYRCTSCASENHFNYTITDTLGATDEAGVTVFHTGGGGLPPF